MTDKSQQQSDYWTRWSRKCSVRLLSQVTWKRQDEVHPLTIGVYPFAPDTRIGIDFNQRTNEWSLIIQDIRPMDEGIYQCQISTKNDHDSYDIQLNVHSEYSNNPSVVMTARSIVETRVRMVIPDPCVRHQRRVKLTMRRKLFAAQVHAKLSSI
jgi:Immunoglobulin I-set domain